MGRPHKLFCFALGFFFLSCHHHLPLCCGQLSSTVSDGGLADSGLDDRPPIYIVFVRKPEHMLSANPAELESWHRSFLPTANLSSGEPRMVYSYDKAISGFAARLTPEEVRAMESKEGFLHAQQDEQLVRQTTYTPNFLRLRPLVWQVENRGEGVIIGVVDSGINPTHASFDDAGFLPPPPPRWKGSCEFNGQSVCNNKLLGARNFDLRSKQQNPLPYDFLGHGTHVASTAAGNEVLGASIGGLANGTASGAAPGAYLAIYKALQISEVLLAINQAINDGVDILSISMVHLNPYLPLFLDMMAIGGLSAVRNGIFVSFAAGNYGPSPRSLRNDAPWILTVGASSTDRALRVLLELGNRTLITAESLYGGPLASGWPLAFPGANGNPAFQTCSWLPVRLTGRIVMCVTSSFGSSMSQAQAVYNAGGASMILMNSRERGNSISEIPDTSGLNNFQVFAITYADSLRLVRYTALATPPVVSVRGPTRTVFRVQPSPAVAHFSSRGPSAVNGGIIKPDILSPGVNILAASPFGSNNFYLNSGTSMATPHLSGIAAIVKSSHWGWSPAMIRSAIMTTSVTTDNRGGQISDQTGNPANLFAAGAGNVYPPRVNDPGLVYDVGINDYIQYLCGLGYSDNEVSKIASAPQVCAQVGSINAEQLNYPSISASLNSRNPRAVIQRVVTHVGPPSLVDYMAEVNLPLAVQAVVRPSNLSFSRVGERKGFTVTFTRGNPPSLGQFEGQLRWVSNNKKHVVASPLLVAVA